MPGRVQQHANVLLGLALSKLGTQTHSLGHLGVKIGHLEIEVQHHLLLTGLPWPPRPNIVGIVLDAEVGDAFSEIQQAIHLIKTMDLPAAQLGIEPRERRDVIGINDNSPPIVALPTVRVIAHAIQFGVNRMINRGLWPISGHNPLLIKDREGAATR